MSNCQLSSSISSRLPQCGRRSALDRQHAKSLFNSSALFVRAVAQENVQQGGALCADDRHNLRTRTAVAPTERVANAAADAGVRAAFGPSASFGAGASNDVCFGGLHFIGMHYLLPLLLRTLPHFFSFTLSKTHSYGNFWLPLQQR